MTSPTETKARPLTERQEAIVLLLASHKAAMIPNDIAIGIGLDGNRARRASDTWSGPMGPAQRIIGSLVGLRRRQFVQTAGRRDGRSGTAYVLTDAGQSAAVAIRERDAR